MELSKKNTAIILKRIMKEKNNIMDNKIIPWPYVKPILQKFQFMYMNRKTIKKLKLANKQQKQKKMIEIRTFEAFAGYGSQLMALRRLERDYPGMIKVTPIGISEIDPHAIKAYKSVHGDVKNYGDISKIDWAQVPDFDLFTYSFPCQSISNAGLQHGFLEGSNTRSSLLWECRNAIIAKKPKWLLMENVAALVQAKFIKLFNKWQLELESYGYKNFAKVLNAKNYGVPQNRERIFMVSILDENAKFEFPQPMPLTRKLKDVLEKDVDERYYLSYEKIKGLNLISQKQKEKNRGFLFKPKDEQSQYANAITTMAGQSQTDNFVKIVGNLYDTSTRGKAAGIIIGDSGGIFNTIRSGDNAKILEYDEKDKVENSEQC